jgi:trans-aconitate 2-methyltransferase
MAQHYTFGDNDRAARRLRSLAAVYEPTSAALLRRFARTCPRLAADLGAGLGLTTRLVHAATGAKETVGLDSSARFLESALEEAPAGVTYQVHDVTRTPFPCGAPDFIYARFLLTHLAHPEVVLGTWREASAPGATLVLEETAELASEHPVLGRYYELVEAMQRHYGQSLRIGRTLAELGSGAGWRIVDARIAPVAVAAPEMARLHVEKIRTWKDDPFAVGHLDPGELRAVEQGLEAIADGREQASVVAAMGQVVALC